MKSQIPSTKPGPRPEGGDSEGEISRFQVSGKRDIKAETLVIVICDFYSSSTPSLQYPNTPTFLCGLRDLCGKRQKTLGRAPHVGLSFSKSRLRCSSDQR